MKDNNYSPQLNEQVLFIPDGYKVELIAIRGRHFEYQLTKEGQTKKAILYNTTNRPTIGQIKEAQFL